MNADGKSDDFVLPATQANKAGTPVAEFVEERRSPNGSACEFIRMLANHNTGSIVNGMATIHWASTIRDYLACETVFFDVGWMDDVIGHNEPLCRDGFVGVPDKAGL